MWFKPLRFKYGFSICAARYNPVGAYGISVDGEDLDENGAGAARVYSVLFTPPHYLVICPFIHTPHYLVICPFTPHLKPPFLTRPSA